MAVVAPVLLKEHQFKVDVSPDRNLVWVLAKKERVPPNKLADRIFRLFLDLISRSNRGEIVAPSLF
jgi:hypothetical protein